MFLTFPHFQDLLDTLKNVIIDLIDRKIRFNQILFHILVTPTLVPRTPVDKDAAMDILLFEKN